MIDTSPLLHRQDDCRVAYPVLVYGKMPVGLYADRQGPLAWLLPPRVWQVYTESWLFLCATSCVWTLFFLSGPFKPGGGLLLNALPQSILYIHLPLMVVQPGPPTLRELGDSDGIQLEQMNPPDQCR